MAAFEVWNVEISRKINLDDTFAIQDKIFPYATPRVMAAFEVWNVEIFRRINLDETFGIHYKRFSYAVPK